ncbi:MAG: SUMF1/EgtB/PvdO family nonheme iron enzyme, partial [Myxococcota bacterium]
KRARGLFLFMVQYAKDYPAQLSHLDIHYKFFLLFDDNSQVPSQEATPLQEETLNALIDLAKFDGKTAKKIEQARAKARVSKGTSRGGNKTSSPTGYNTGIVPGRTPSVVQADARPASAAVDQQKPGAHRVDIFPRESSYYREPVAGISFLYVKGGPFTMGTRSPDADSCEKPEHEVTLTEFWLAETPVTNKQYRKYLEDVEYHEYRYQKPETPQYWSKENLNQPRQPVVGVSWHGAVGFCHWLQDKIAETDPLEVARLTIALPTEAQWEFAARGRNKWEYPWGPEEPTQEHARFAAETSIEVKSLSKGKGPFGHYDLAGNVQEWCWDVWDHDAYSNRLPLAKNPCVTGDGNSRSLRGGGFKNGPRELRTTARNHHSPNVCAKHIGFRVAMSVGDLFDPVTGIRFVLIPKGSFQMGDDASADADNSPEHRVSVTVPRFWASVTPVTNRQYEYFSMASGSWSRNWSQPRFNEPDQPVVGVSWTEAVKFC